MNYKGTKITRNEKTGSYYLNSPVNGTLRIFKSLEKAQQYIDRAFVLDSHAKAMHD